jgi:transcriptional regulator with XRE-family HTH domain
MSTTQRAIDRGRERGRRLRIELGRELREARLAAGLSQARLGRAAGIHASTVGRIERAEIVSASVQRFAELFALVGQELAARGYPVGPPIRDRGQVGLLTRFRARVRGEWLWRFEVPSGGAGDLRAWDAVLTHGQARVAVEAETRLGDIQALMRRIEIKCRDSGMDRVLLVVADTRSNRAAVAAAGAILESRFRMSATAAWAALRLGRDPGGSAILLV